MPGVRQGPGALSRAIVCALALLGAASCEELYPEVLVVNEIDEAVLVRDASWNGCLWDEVLAFGETSSPGRCLPGEDRMHFVRLDATSYCRDQVEDGTIPEICFCRPEDEPDEDALDPGLVNEEPMWFGYQTLTVFGAGPGDVVLVRLTASDMEQDFSVPGPYGH